MREWTGEHAQRAPRTVVVEQRHNHIPGYVCMITGCDGLGRVVGVKVVKGEVMPSSVVDTEEGKVG